MSQDFSLTTGQTAERLRRIALIPAAGVGARMGSTLPKQYLMLGRRCILQHTIQAFLDHPAIDHVYVVVSPADGYADELLQRDSRLTILRCGGESRRDSVLNGLQQLSQHVQLQDWVLVHDAARPGLNQTLLNRLLEQAGASPVGGILALPVVDTVKKVTAGQVSTIEREGLWLAQTPQMFHYGMLKQALEIAEQVTDEASAIEALGYAPLMVEGHLCNLKLTRPADLQLLQQFMPDVDVA